MLYLRVCQKDFCCIHDFEHSYHLSNKISWRRTRKYVDVIICYFHFLYFTILSWQYLFKQLFCSLSHLFFQHPFAIFGCLYKVASCVVNSMAHSFEGHATYHNKFLNQCNSFLTALLHGMSKVAFS